MSLKQNDEYNEAKRENEEERLYQTLDKAIEDGQINEEEARNIYFN